MLSKLLSRAIAKFGRLASANRLRTADEKILAAIDRCANDDFAAAGALAEAVIAHAPGHAGAHYLLGLLACHGGAVGVGARSIERALALEPGNTQFLAALADARLLQEREDEALALYGEAFPREWTSIGGLDDAGLSWKRAHPVWTRDLRRVVLPLPDSTTAKARARGTIQLSDAVPGHLLNWALLLISRRQGRRAMWLLEKAIAADAHLAYAHAALALLRTLNRDWSMALAAAKRARVLGAEVFPGANDLCVIASQLGLGTNIPDLDPLFDWSALSGAHVPGASRLECLPLIEGDAFPQFPAGVLVCFIACDSRYLLDHAIALACSIRENAGNCAVHLHVYNPTPEDWSTIHKLTRAVAPMQLSTTWEAVDFERYGGKGMYCANVRFWRLHQILQSTPNRVAMLDADSLVRGDLASALGGCRAIGLVRAADEPMWHQYLAGFTVFRRCAEVERFLGELGFFLVSNVLACRGRTYLDQIGLYVCARHCSEAVGDAIEALPIERFCDTLFQDTAIVWSVTQNKTDDSPFSRYRRLMLARFENCGDNP